MILKHVSKGRVESTGAEAEVEAGGGAEVEAGVEAEAVHEKREKKLGFSTNDPKFAIRCMG